MANKPRKKPAPKTDAAAPVTPPAAGAQTAGTQPGETAAANRI
ncbi:MAG TPA: hypothetical protein QF891_05240 [Rhodospirillales bacterium]|nr:hypothetical protein [Rhodospirillales bacterium]